MGVYVVLLPALRQRFCQPTYATGGTAAPSAAVLGLVASVMSYLTALGGARRSALVARNERSARLQVNALRLGGGAIDCT